MKLEVDIASRHESVGAEAVLSLPDYVVPAEEVRLFSCSQAFQAGCAPAFLNIWQQLVDGLTEQVALLDDNWTILVCNGAWTRSVEHHGRFALAPGANYLEFVRSHAAEGDFAAQDTFAGLQEIIAGKRSSYRMIYNGSEHWTGCDTEISVRQFEVNGHKFASVTRYDVSKMLELRKLRQEFSGSVMHEQAEERRRIGREIHDSTAQSLVALGLTLGQLRRTCRTNAYPIFDEMQQLLAQAQQEIRSISYLIHPPVLGKVTLSDALLALAEGFGRRTGLDIRFDLVDEPRICCPTAEEALYRVAQEALSNVHRHSQARHVTIRLSQGKTVTHVVIADDGVGIPVPVTPGVGLPGMHARLAELGGRLSIRRRSPGTAVIATVPSDRAVRHREGSRRRL